MDTPAATSSAYKRAQPDGSIIKEMHQALRNLGGETAYKRAKLEQLTRLLSSCQAKRYRKQHPSKQAHHALKAVLTTALNTLMTENPKYALLLWWRYWKDNSVNEVLTEGHAFIERYGPMSERQLFVVQREAISLLAGVFAELEDLRNKELTQVVPPTRSRRASDTTHVVPSIIHREENNLKYTAGPIPLDVLRVKDLVTRREAQILIAYSWGYTPRTIAEIFWISETTVRTHLQNVREKLYAQTITHALWLANYYELLKSYEADVELMIQKYFETRD
jgi:DNA-binding CsgD family transcriptional regulator